MNGNTIHGLTRTKEYFIWSSIKQRCYNINNKAYKNYGGRGIKMYMGWIDDPEYFIEYIKSLPDYGKEGYTLDRINNDGWYEKGNLRWDDRTTQAINRRKLPCKIDYTGVCFKDNIYEARITVNYKNIYLGRFYSIEEAVEARNKYIVENNLKNKIQIYESNKI